MKTMLKYWLIITILWWFLKNQLFVQTQYANLVVSLVFYDSIAKTYSQTFTCSDTCFFFLNVTLYALYFFCVHNGKECLIICFSGHSYVPSAYVDACSQVNVSFIRSGDCNGGVLSKL